MKISQREKTMLIVLCIAMIAALAYMFIIKPLNLQKDELDEALTEKETEWTEMTDPILINFGMQELYAKQVWELSGSALRNELNNLIINNAKYSLGNNITNTQGKALQISGTSVLPAQDTYELYAFLDSQFFTGNIDYADRKIDRLTETTYTMPTEETEPVEGEEPVEPPQYVIMTAKVLVSTFNTPSAENLFTMLNKMEKCGYIIIEAMEFSPASLSGSLEFLVVMTPGDLGAYNVIVCPNCVKYIHGDSVKCKWCGALLDQSEEE